MAVLSRNLDALRGRNPELAERIQNCVPSPELEVLEARSRARTFRVDGRLEASAEDPEAEARKLVAGFLEHAERAGAERLVVFGLGVHSLRFLTEFSGRLLVVEPSLELCRRVLEHIDLSIALEAIELIAGEDPAPVLRHELFRASERGLFLSHPATRRRAAKLHDDLAQRFHPGGVASPLNVAVIPPLYGGSLPIAQACARALRQLGHYVRPIDLSAFWVSYQEIQRVTANPRLSQISDTLRAALVRLIGETLLASFRLDPPDLVFAVAQAPLDPDVLDRMGQMGITRAFWFCEDFHVMSYWHEIARHYDTIFHLQPDDLSEPLRNAGAYGVPLPLAIDPSVTHPLDLDVESRQRYGCDVSFLGAGYHNRRCFLPALFDLGLRIYGTEWPEWDPFKSAMPEPNERQSTEASNVIFNATRINLNLHSSPWCDGVNPVGDYLNPRTFELAGARAFQLVDQRRDLSRVFKPGHDLDSFGDLTECRKKIAYYLKHPSECSEMAENAYQRVLKQHTYRHRMEEAIDTLRAGPVPLMPRRSELPTVASVIDAARDEPGLLAILEHLDPETVMDSDAITEAVIRGSGPLSRDEKLLLYMRESLGELEYLNSTGQTD